MKVTTESSRHPVDSGGIDDKIPLPRPGLNGPGRGEKTTPNREWLGGVLIEFFDKWIVGISREGVCPNVPVYRCGSGEIQVVILPWRPLGRCG